MNAYAVSQKSGNIPKILFLFLNGGVLYYAIEIFWRGWSHWSMALCGAVCFALMYRFNRRHAKTLLVLRALFGALLITATELCAGTVLNLWLRMNIWDYHDMPLQFLGQICLPYSVLWFLLCIPVFAFCTVIRRAFFPEDERE